MMDKDKVLPLACSQILSFSPEYLLGYEKGQEQQREADWERVKPLVEALQYTNAKLEAWASMYPGREPAWAAIGRLKAQEALAQLEEGKNP